MRSLCELTAAEAARSIKSKTISAQALAKACAERIRLMEPRLNAWAFFSEELFLKQAALVDEKIAGGHTVGILGGVPVGMKDIFNTIDMPTEMGSPIWKNFTPGNDARVVHYLKMADAVVAGKTVTAEFAVHAPGPTVNPLNPTRIPGTSSSGSAVAVAAQMVPCAIGTQTAGSVIRPASYCGVFGFKPSFGLLPRTGMLKTTDSLDTIGCFARSADDLELLFDAMRVRGMDYPLSDARMEDLRWQLPAGGRWKVAVMRTPVSHLAEKYAQKSLRDFIETLAGEKDFEVSEKDLPDSFQEAHAVHGTIYDKSLAYYFKNEFKEKTLISKEIKEMIEHGQRIPLDDFQKAIHEQNRLSHWLDEFLGKNDILLTLSTTGEAPELGVPEKPDNCLIWTLCGIPTLSLPLLRGPSGLPMGVHIAARRYSDYKLLNFAKLLAERGLGAMQSAGEKR